MKDQENLRSMKSLPALPLQSRGAKDHRDALVLENIISEFLKLRLVCIQVVQQILCKFNILVVQKSKTSQ